MMSDQEIVALILLWGRIAPDLPNAYDARCDEQKWAERNSRRDEEDIEFLESVEREIEIEDAKYGQQWGE